MGAAGLKRNERVQVLMLDRERQADHCDEQQHSQRRDYREERQVADLAGMHLDTCIDTCGADGSME
jgi:hypothetical protein